MMNAQDVRAEVWEELRKLTRAHNSCVRKLQAEIEELREQVAEMAKALPPIQSGGKALPQAA